MPDRHAKPAPRRLIDPSHVIRGDMTTYRGLPGPRIKPFIDRATSRGSRDGTTEFQIDHVCMVGNTGTYLDSLRASH